MRIVWDEPKRRQNLAKHELDFSSLHGFDWTASIVFPSRAGRFGGQRFKAIGRLNDDLVVVVFGRLGTEAISVISLRRASRAERRLYEQS